MGSRAILSVICADCRCVHDTLFCQTGETTATSRGLLISSFNNLFITSPHTL